MNEDSWLEERYEDDYNTWEEPEEVDEFDLPLEERSETWWFRHSQRAARDAWGDEYDDVWDE